MDFDYRFKPSINSGWVRAVCSGFTQLGADVDDLLKKADIDIALLSDPDTRVETSKMSRLWEMVREDTQREDIGLIVAGSLQAGHLQCLGFTLLTTANMGEFLSRLQKYFAVVTDVAELLLEHTQEGILLRYRQFPSEVKLADEAVDAAIGSILSWMRLVISPDHAPKEVMLKRQKPDNTTPFEQFFACPIRFSASHNAILIQHETFKVPFVNANPRLSALNSAFLDKQLEKIKSNLIEHKVKNKLVKLLPAGNCSQEKLAASLNMSTSTLHRLLKNEKTSYRELLDEIRQTLANHYITHSDDSISEIAYNLGFSDVSNFSHAFRRWFNMSPRNYRNNSPSRHVETAR